MAEGNPLRCSAVTIRRAAFDDVGGFDPSLRYVLDWEFWLRLSRRWKVAWLARPSVRIRWHGASETHRFKAGTADLDESARMMEQLFSFDLGAHPEASRWRRAASRKLARAFLNRAHDSLRSGHTELGRQALRRGLAFAPSQVSTILGKPRLLVQMATLAVMPRLAGRLFGPGCDATASEGTSAHHGGEKTDSNV
jgi:hypothetical protein